MFDLFTFGEAMALFLSQDTDDVVSAKVFARSTAGAEANVAVALTRLGLKVYFYTHLGEDQLGTALINDFNHEGVDVSGVKRVAEFTGSMARNPGTSRPVEATYLRKGSAASTIASSDMNVDVISQSRWVHTTGITCAISQSAAQAVKFALETAREKKIPCSLDLNIRRKLWSEEEARGVLEPLAHDVDLLIGGEDEYQLIFGQLDPRKSIEIAHHRGCAVVVMTKGDQPIRYSINGEYGEIVPPKVHAIDPVGSGDAFTGGVIAGLLSGLRPVEAIIQGSISGARVASFFGDWAGLPTGAHGRTDPAIIAEITGGAKR